MRKLYERKPKKEKKVAVPVTHCESCQHFRWGLRTAFYDTDGSCTLTNRAKSHNKDGCQHWERK